jgi:hypothetical protein
MRSDAVVARSSSGPKLASIQPRFSNCRLGIALLPLPSHFGVERIAASDRISVVHAAATAPVHSLENVTVLSHRPDVPGKARRRRIGTRHVIEQLRDWARQQQLVLVPKSALGEAVGYMMGQGDSLLAFLDDGRVDPDNNWVERALRPIAVGRKAYLFAGSEASGHRAAIVYTILGNCLMAGVDPWNYLQDVLSKLACGWPMSRLAELLPQAWAEQRRQQGQPHAHASPDPAPG